VSIRLLAPVALCSLLLTALPVRADDEPGYVGVQVRLPEEGKGVLITGLISDAPADRAGLKVDDVIAEVDGKPVTELKGFVDTIRGHKPGDTITLKVLRNGKGQDIKVKVGKPPAG
jgi:S1-C subfamily serine protease